MKGGKAGRGGVFRPTVALLSWRPLGIVPAMAGVSAGSGSLPSAFASVASVVSSPVSACVPALVTVVLLLLCKSTGSPSLL